VISIFVSHLCSGHVFETRIIEWRIARKVVDVELLTLKRASGTPRSPVNNCGEVEREPDHVMQDTPPEYVTAVMKLIESGEVSWNDPDVAMEFADFLTLLCLNSVRQL